MMEIIEGKWFRLPLLGTDNFRTLMSLGVKYDKSKGMLVDEGTNKSLLIPFLSEVIKQDVIIYKVCAICETNIDCRICEYSSECDYHNSSSLCMCNNCLGREESYAFYIASQIE